MEKTGQVETLLCEKFRSGMKFIACSAVISTYLESSSASVVVALPHGDKDTIFPIEITLLPGMFEGAELRI